VAHISKLRILDATDAREWDRWVRALPEADAYYLHGYVSLAEVLGEGEARMAVLETSSGRVIYPFVQRSISELPFASSIPDVGQYLDITSPYGYGGPLVTTASGCAEEAVDPLAREFDGLFRRWCRANNVVSEFVRFHPLADNVAVFGHLYGATLDRSTVYLDLTSGKERVWQGLARTSRRNVRRARRSGLTVVSESGGDGLPAGLHGFRELYRHTMDRNEASGYYYFGKDYFDQLFRRLGPRAVLISVHREEAIVASMIMLAYRRWLHAHLAGSDTALLSLRPNDLLFFEAAAWGANHGFEILHLGGGRTAEDDDSLLRFKASFSPCRAEFHTAARIHLPDTYTKLEQAWRCHKGEAPSNSFFPTYRQ